ncbi:MAG: helix-turn-helix transcriptional regulator [Algoriphagus sp.]|jgi:transcriptional regulator with XRE-family HTH domain|uniref:helix-turn-helix domain-containing protein n=1 Tax=Algoriphagus sp. TaxID=1872435 RepID=UPI002723F258|nr:helix-turn-helix transcriptional regulator [Algoriphagus sp.]MDO8966801.1 helix-turn-helix transcriptional regulator [Algoriphagus sp.]MDP2039623.1 helix-turn-helix transcriptional regulator [Algoriphagus sp.]MDP3199876.1 helix-turn-helix transcriptional regulator [Algoriphagus sp.]MDP3473386.1 helix-turn-helix transcriptional regulator [Algoriphagus sp.]
MDIAQLSDMAILRMIGDFIKKKRMALNKTQDTLAEEASISRSTLSLLERGEKVNLITLIQVLRVLDELQILEAFEVRQQISPIEYIKLQKKYERQRVRNTDVAADNPPSEW